MAKILTIGTFDLFHYGHLNLLREAYYEAGEGKVIVGLNTDDFIKRYKRNAPVMDYFERRAVLLGCKYVDEVVENMGDESCQAIIREVRPDKLVVGSDWMSRDYLKQIGVTQDWLDSKDIRVIYVPYTTTISSTDIKERIRA